MLGGFLQSILQSVCYKEIEMSLKVRVIPSGTLSYGVRTFSENFAAACQSSQCSVNLA